jgi:hypothetical protein
LIDLSDDTPPKPTSSARRPVKADAGSSSTSKTKSKSKAKEVQVEEELDDMDDFHDLDFLDDIDLDNLDLVFSRPTTPAEHSDHLQPPIPNPIPQAKTGTQ